MITTQPIAITLTASDWLQIAGWMFSEKTRPAAVNHLLDGIGQTVLKDDR
jgi:hypothetical protein